MAVTRDDVRAIAALARLDVPASGIDAVVVDLNAILSHMAVLARVEGRDPRAVAGASDSGMPLAPDRGPSVALDRPPAHNAPLWRDGFFLVPRLDTHDGAGATDTDES
jgi:Asp-tRNA(Asn)/Glu-tRNA(Gln) amidotransferase C subunit